MVKDETLVLRVDGALKETLKRAADHTGETMTGFATRALRERADKVLSRPRRKLSDYFQALATRAAAGGGGTWKSAGYQFAQDCVPDLVGKMGQARARAEFVRLEVLASVGESAPLSIDGLESVLGWFETHFPECVDLIPHRRRLAFAQGAAQRAFEDGIDT